MADWEVRVVAGARAPLQVSGKQERGKEQSSPFPQTVQDCPCPRATAGEV